MKSKEIILEQLKATHNKSLWFVSFASAVAGLTAAQAAMKDASGNHSVWGIVNHLMFWNGRMLKRFRGEVPPKTDIENIMTFETGKADDENWQKTLSDYDAVLNEFEEILMKKSEEELSSEAFPGYNATWYEMFTDMTIHNAYHIGQIVHLRKQFGIWNPELGVL